MAAKWEYKHILAETGKDKKWYPTRINDQSVQDWENGKPLIEYMNELGDEGWELVSAEIQEPTHTSTWQYSFVPINYGWAELKTSEGTKYKGPQGYLDYFNRAGGDGWELTFIMTNYDTMWHPDGYVAIFKHESKHRIWRLVMKRSKDQ